MIELAIRSVLMALLAGCTTFLVVTGHWVFAIIMLILTLLVAMGGGSDT